MSRSTPFSVLALGVVAVVAAACADQPGPTDVADVELAPERAEAELASVSMPQSPDDRATVAGVTFWPYTARTPSLHDPADPINLVFTGEGADPRLIRAALMELGGDRSALGLPNAPPFDCVWTDAIGATQAVFAEDHGWSGSAVQLQCGTYEELRFHVRLFRVGDVTVGNAHLDVRIPGTTDHDVLSWELPQLLVMLDLQRLGATPSFVGPINQNPTYRQVLEPIFDGIMANQPALFGLLTTPPTPLPPSIHVSDRALFNDGVASVLDVPAFQAPPGGTEISRQTVEIQFGQFIPRPFCEGGEAEILRVDGPVTLTQQVVYTSSGQFISRYHARGHLDVQIVSPVPSEPYRALVNQHGRSVLTDQVNMANDIQLRMEIRGQGEERGQLRINFRIGPDGAGEADVTASCKP